MKEIWLIRHAESEANAGLRTSVPAEVALTTRGMAQAKIVAALFDQAPPVIIISPYLRTRQTAEPLLEKFPKVNVETWAMQEFTYLSVASTRDSTFAERKPLVDAFWARSDPAYCDGKGAESFASFWRRAKDAIDKIVTGAPDKTVIFCHAQFARAMLWQMLVAQDATAEVMRAFFLFMKAINIPNTAVIKLLIDAEQKDVYTSEIKFSHLPPNLLTY
ncbi:MAG: histidine phosphatase family protein [Pyrinomonadaceae bacterium]